MHAYKTQHTADSILASSRHFKLEKEWLAIHDECRRVSDIHSVRNPIVRWLVSLESESWLCFV